MKDDTSRLTYKSEYSYDLILLLLTVQPTSVRVVDESTQQTLEDGRVLGPVIENSPIALRCESGKGRPVPKVEWYNGDQLLKCKIKLTALNRPLEQKLRISVETRSIKMVWKLKNNNSQNFFSRKFDGARGTRYRNRQQHAQSRGRAQRIGSHFHLQGQQFGPLRASQDRHQTGRTRLVTPVYFCVAAESVYSINHSIRGRRRTFRQIQMDYSRIELWWFIAMLAIIITQHPGGAAWKFQALGSSPLALASTSPCVST